MTTDKDMLKKSVEVLIEKAGDAAELAKNQRNTADAQHETAHKLEDLSKELTEGAAELKENLDHLPKK